MISVVPGITALPPSPTSLNCTSTAGRRTPTGRPWSGGILHKLLTRRESSTARTRDPGFFVSRPFCRSPWRSRSPSSSSAQSHASASASIWNDFAIAAVGIAVATHRYVKHFPWNVPAGGAGRGQLKLLSAPPACDCAYSFREVGRLRESTGYPNSGRARTARCS